jgi:hypothetical protein
MSNVTHRTTLEYRRSVNTPDYSDPPWLINSPEANALYEAGVPNRYWKISGDIVSEMSSAEKAAVDAANESASRDAVAEQLDRVEYVLGAFALVLLDELNGHVAHINSILDAIDAANNLSALKTTIAAIPDYPTRNLAQLKAAIRSKLGT